MTRSIPSIIVLTLMCFTISYGLVFFPDAGILDSVPNASSDNQTVTVLKPTSEDSALPPSQPVTSALPETQASQDELFVLESDTSSGKKPASSNDDCNNSVNNAQENNSNNKTNAKTDSPKKNKSRSKKALTADVPADKTENKAEKTESKDANAPKPESQPDNNSNDQNDSLELIGIPDDDQSANDDSMPIKSDLNPMPMIDPLTSDVPSVVVEHNPPTSEPEPLSDSEMPMIDDLSIPEMSPEKEQSIDDYWENYLNENSPSNALPSNNDQTSADTASSSAAEKQAQETKAPTEIKTDPNAQEIPAKNREMKPANQDALTLPALDELQDFNPNSNQPDTGTIPLESFPLDASAVQKANYTAGCQQDPYDVYGFDIPEAGPIVVKRFPPIENSIDPIYNNAQLDKFAL